MVMTADLDENIDGTLRVTSINAGEITEIGHEDTYSKHDSSENVQSQINGEVQIVNFVYDNHAIKTEKQDDEQEENVDGEAPKRTMGPLRGASIIAGTMIGSGVLITTRGVLTGTGSIDACLCVWLGCGVISLLGALCYAELSSMIHHAGGEYGYLLNAYGGFTRFLGPIPAFLYVWTFVLLVVPARLGVISQAMAEYITYPLFDACGAPDFIKKMLAVSCILFITAVNCASTKASLAVQNIFVTAKFLALAVISVGGIVKLAEGNVLNFSAGFTGTVQSPSAIALAFYNGLFSYVGWNSVGLLTEIKNPKRNLPLAIAISVPMVTILFLLVNVSYFTVVTKDEMPRTAAIGVLWGDHVLGVMAWVMPVTVALAKIGACNGIILSSSRAVFAPARKGHVPAMLSSTHVTRFTPVAALILNAIVTICLVISNSIPTLINFYTFTSWLFNGLVFLGLIVMRVTMKDLNRPYKVPLLIPILCLLISAYLVVAPVVEIPSVEYLSALVSTIGGLLYYVPFVFLQLRIPGIECVTAFVLVFLESAPST